MLYLRFNDERKRLMREMEESKLIIGTGNDSQRKKYVEHNSLEEIPEDEDDGGAGSDNEEHNIYENNSSKGSKEGKVKKGTRSNEEDDKSSQKSSNKSKSSSAKSGGLHKKGSDGYFDNNDYKKKSLLDTSQKSIKGQPTKITSKISNINKNSLIPENKGKHNIKNKTISAANNSSGDDSFENQSSSHKQANKIVGDKLNYKEKEINLHNNFKSQKSAISNMSKDNYESDRPNIIKNLQQANPQNEDANANDIKNLQNYEDPEKNQYINQMFLEKVEKIIVFLEEHKVEFNNTESVNKPLEMLKKLRDIQDTNERNEMIGKIEEIVAVLFNEKNNKD